MISRLLSCAPLALVSILFWAGCKRSPSANLGTERALATIATNETAQLRSIYVSQDGEKSALHYEGRLQLSQEQRTRMEQDLERWLKGQGSLGLVLREVEQNHRQSWMVVEGEPQNPVYSIWTTAFSPNGEHFGYIVFNQGRDVQKRGNQTSSRARYDTYLVVDGQAQGKIYSSLTEERPIRDFQFSADSTTWSCTALVSTQQHFTVVVNGRELGLYPNRPHVRFAPSGADFFFTSRSNNLELVVHGGKVLGPYKHVSDPVFSSDGRDFAFMAEYPDKAVFVLNDVEQPIEYRGFNLQLGQSGQTRVWVEADRARRRLSFNGKPGDWVEDVTSVTLAPDGQRVAYIARKGNAFHVVVNNLTWEDHGRPRQLLWSNDGTRLACIMSDTKNKPATKRVVIDNKPGKEFSEIDSMQFSPDGSRLAYVGHTPERAVLVADTAEQELPAASSYKLKFSPDGQHIAVAIKVSETNAMCIVDGKPHRGFEQVEEVAWTGDSRHVGYVTRDNPGQKISYAYGEKIERVAVVIDGKVGRQYDAILHVSDRRLWANQDGELCWTGIRGTNVLVGRFE